MIAQSPSGPLPAPATGKIIHGVQWLRAIAATLVVLRHTAKEFSANHAEAFAVGQAGVDIFFLISGFVIFTTGRQLPWGAFVYRRLSRIAPLYWLALAITVAADIARHAHLGPGWLHNVLLSFVFLPSADASGGVFPPLVVGWTINFEIYFYAIFALVLAFVPRERLLHAVSAIIVGAVILGSLVSIALGVRPGSVPANILFLPLTLEFVAGMWIARLWSIGWRLPPPLALALILASVIAIALVPSSSPYTLLRPLYWGIPAVGILLGTLSLEGRFAFSAFRLPLLLGDASYALYLFHPIVIGLSMAILAHSPVALPAPAAFLFIVLLCLAVGISMHLVIERPLMQMMARFWRTRVSPKGREAGATQSI